jgi:hypothetical protein
VEASVLLCDFAEEINGKLYVMGAGWDRLAANNPSQIAVAISLDVPWDQANRPHDIKLELLDEDGNVVTPPDSDEPLAIGGKIEVGRPAGTAPGATLAAPLAMRFQGFQLPPGRYSFQFSVDGKVLSAKTFTVIDPQG